jgi:hypothetical protein
MGVLKQATKGYEKKTKKGCERTKKKKKAAP